MEAQTTPTPTPAAPPPAPAPPPQSVAPAPMNAAAPQKMEGGGTIADTFKNLNWVQVGFGILGSAALYYAIYYFRYNIQMNKTFVKNVENRMDDLTIKISDVASVVHSSQQQQNNGDIFF